MKGLHTWSTCELDKINRFYVRDRFLLALNAKIQFKKLKMFDILFPIFTLVSRNPVFK